MLLSCVDLTSGQGLLTCSVRFRPTLGGSGTVALFNLCFLCCVWVEEIVFCAIYYVFLPTTDIMVKNSAFVFVKPHANNKAVQELVRKEIQAKGIKITSEGSIASEKIDSERLIDQHYYAIANKAVLKKPNELNVPEALFQKKFGLSWADALKQNLVFNAMDACQVLGITAEEMDKQGAVAKKADLMVKFGGGFYCTKVVMAGKNPIYVINGFYMAMRSKFTIKGESIYYFTVEWEAAQLSFDDFREKVLGPTDPAVAPATSVRGLLYAQWQTLGLKAIPDGGDNGVHASASPFEALAERMNWLKVKVCVRWFCCWGD